MRIHRAKGAAEGGQIWDEARGETGPSQGFRPHCPLRRKPQLVWWGHWPCLAGLWLPARLGHQSRPREQGQGPAGLLLFLTPAGPPALPSPSPTSFSLSSRTLFVCVSAPG